jgi:hypothetical protein
MAAIQQMLLAAAPPAGLTFVSSETTTSDAASFSLSIPAGAQVDDAVIIVVHVANKAGSTPPSNTFGGTGYTSDATSTFATGTHRLQVFVKRFTTTPESVVNFSQTAGANRINAVAHLWRGGSASQILDVTSTVSTGTDSGPAITPVTAGAVVLSIIGQFTSTLGGGQAVPSGYSNTAIRAQTDSYSWLGSTMEARTGMASKPWSGSGAETPGAWTSGGSYDTCRITLALRPA